MSEESQSTIRPDLGSELRISSGSDEGVSLDRMRCTTRARSDYTLQAKCEERCNEASHFSPNFESYPPIPIGTFQMIY